MKHNFHDERKNLHLRKRNVRASRNLRKGKTFKSEKRNQKKIFSSSTAFHDLVPYCFTSVPMLYIPARDSLNDENSLHQNFKISFIRIS